MLQWVELKPLCPRNKEEFGTEHMSHVAEEAGPELTKQNLELLETSMSNVEFILFVLLCCKLI